MMNLGKNTGQGFLPNVPSLDDLLQGKGILAQGFDGLKNTTAGKHLSDATETPNKDLKRSYYRMFNGNGSQQDADVVLEDLLNQTLRRAKMMPKAGMTFDELMPYFTERHGQDGVMTYILKMIQDGHDLPAPESKKNKSKK